jgi:hypothetical protein
MRERRGGSMDAARYDAAWGARGAANDHARVEGACIGVDIPFLPSSVDRLYRR